MNTFVKQYRSALKIGTPIVGVITPDPAATVQHIKDNIKPRPLFMWDVMRGIIPLNPEAGSAEIELPEGAELGMIKNPMAMLTVALTLPERSIMFAVNLQDHFKEPSIIQGIWNLRDPFKASKRQLVMLGVSISLPAAIAGDVMLLDEPLPLVEQLKAVVQNAFEANGMTPKASDREVGAGALCGLNLYTAEQAMMMSIDPDTKTFDVPTLIERKRRQIEQVKGLTVNRTLETFDDITGLENAKLFYHMRGAGKKPRRGVIIIDEIEKHVANFGASGTGDPTAEMVGVLLSEMTAMKAEGNLNVGVNGSGKTLLAKALGNEWGVPTIWFDFSGMKGSHVGDSGEAIRLAIKTVRAMTEDAPYFFATSNNLTVLPPELRRRFSGPIFFYDLPTVAEQAAAWSFYMKMYKLTGKVPPVTDWTPSEISVCCYQAYVNNCSMQEAAKYIVPTSRSGAVKIRELREQAHNTFISASYEGVYQKPEAKKGRAVGE